MQGRNGAASPFRPPGGLTYGDSVFTLIDRQRWARREYFEHYLTAVPCQYSMTTTVDISGIRRSGRKLYPAMLHALATVINRHEEFRMAFDAEGQLGVHDTLHPSYTIFHQDTETFSSIWTAFDADYETFLQSYRRDLQTWGDVHRLEARPCTPENVFPVSMIPWENFQGFHLHLPKGDRYFFPIFTLGKFREEGGQTLLPVAVQVHHAVCDGFHVCRLLDELRALIDALPADGHAV